MVRLDTTRHVRRVEPMHFGCVELVKQHGATHSKRRARLARHAWHYELDWLNTSNILSPCILAVSILSTAHLDASNVWSRFESWQVEFGLMPLLFSMSIRLCFLRQWFAGVWTPHQHQQPSWRLADGERRRRQSATLVDGYQRNSRQIRLLIVPPATASGGLVTCQVGRLVRRPGGPPPEMLKEVKTIYPDNRGKVVGREGSEWQSHKEEERWKEGVERGRTLS